MAFRWIIVLALGLVSTSCSDGGFIGRTGEFSGVWLHEFEGSMFVEGARDIPAERPDYKATDALEYDSPEPQVREMVGDWSYDEARRCYPVQPFLITFVGRRTYHPFDGAGHMSLHRRKVTVARVIAIRPLGPPFCYEADRMLDPTAEQAGAAGRPPAMTG